MHVLVVCGMNRANEVTPLIRVFVPLQLLIQVWWRQCVAIVGDL